MKTARSTEHLNKSDSVSFTIRVKKTNNVLIREATSPGFLSAEEVATMAKQTRAYARIAQARIEQHREALEQRSAREDIGPDGKWRLPGGFVCSMRLGEVSKLY